MPSSSIRLACFPHYLQTHRSEELATPKLIVDHSRHLPHSFSHTKHGRPTHYLSWFNKKGQTTISSQHQTNFGATFWSCSPKPIPKIHQALSYREAPFTPALLPSELQRVTETSRALAAHHSKSRPG